MKQRPSSRLLVVNAESRLLLFRFEHRTGALAGSVFWAPPGGGLDAGESFEQAACRELLEETGLQLADPGPQVARRRVTFTMPDGGLVEADERYFLVRVPTLEISSSGWTDEERAVVAAHGWWSPADLARATEQVWPEDVTDMLVEAGVWPAGP
ncbi:NUDIX domain-containing protein [Xanthobacter dioxanivorans]|uniref:NUDIX domain-containing protein n=1 Tax=Xanthobacter dioxanivorans TaxID=2528964 RepID=A0A974PS68_9HYPH|nr:NUDIX domain-containing protein [Xanthobacter dioxanivorans]QRG08313.1 NUDIX domain-containing protein [Xanthobacter dioxanivorans]